MTSYVVSSRLILSLAWQQVSPAAILPVNHQILSHGGAKLLTPLKLIGSAKQYLS